MKGTTYSKDKKRIPKLRNKLAIDICLIKLELLFIKIILAPINCR